ncbi:hypothetical protein C3469_19425 [Mycobacterium kansasii]|uniref:hypothetical protein n=1 Tax=Mycobacterium kansasii TaxID=1768 RepID=UPI000CDD431F|nr:hypothetical protein [Mycobacterium kansasii]POX98879.1 hypothetical protein C3479_20940 [Mycobacterium kansasii]POY25310.1 hypothetical protein C3469_19425 [Mycobacterium kansasii]POY31336.1 hypothetical protein C3478_17040 [Mycobacterium kansasii]
MVSQGTDLTREFTSGAVYAIFQLDDVLHRAGEVYTTRLAERPDGKFDVYVKSSFALPQRTQERVVEVLTSLAQVGGVHFEDFPVERH